MRTEQKFSEEDIAGLIAAQLRAAREYRGLGVREAALGLGISRSHLTNIENANRGPSLEVLYKASKLYRVSLDVLMGREELPGKGGHTSLIRKIAALFDQPPLKSKS